MRRAACRAGSFYEADPDDCRDHAMAILQAANASPDTPSFSVGLVPHAGWRFSGKVAATTMKTLLGKPTSPKIIILFGADHVGTVQMGEVYASGVWETPLGDVPIDTELAMELLKNCDLLRENPNAHRSEHSLEVQIPLLKQLVPNLRIVPIGVPVDPMALKIGKAVGDYIANHQRSRDICILGSTDLTHTGGRFGYRSHGPGPQVEAYARANDQRLLSIIERMEAEKVVPEVRAQRNACGGGAITATVAAAAALGASRGKVLEHTSSYAIQRDFNPMHSDDTYVGYASVIFT